MNQNYRFDWSDLAFGSKRELKQLDATFIVAPREITSVRFKQLVKNYLPKGNVVLGVAKEEFVDGFEGQPQFRMLREESVAEVVGHVNRSQDKHGIYILSYFQRELAFILEKSAFSRVVLVNGSWKHTFHTSKPYYIMASSGMKHEFVSPFNDPAEAEDYEATVWDEITANLNTPEYNTPLSEQGMMEAAKQTARCSFDHTFQVGLALGSKTKDKYAFLDSTFNRVVPYQAYALHNGSSREKHLSPPQDLNFYDTVHAEIDMLIRAHKLGTDLKDTTVFMNLLPCPPCARMLSRLDVDEIVYELDHSDGYALSLLETSGKKVRRVTPS